MLSNITLECANKMVVFGLEIAQKQFSGRPLTIAVCDKNGYLLALARMDNAKLLTIELTQRKAYTSSRLGCKTQDFLNRLQLENLDINYFGDERFTALPGGIPLFNSEQQLIGAVGVGGLSAQEDNQAALAVAEYIHSVITH